MTVRYAAVAVDPLTGLLVTWKSGKTARRRQQWCRIL